MGLPNYQFYLGVKYNTGNGIKKTNKKAAKLFRKAAEQGLSPAQLMLAYLCMIGNGVQHDFQQGLHWYHMAAEQNNPIVMRNIAMHRLTEKDYKSAKDLVIIIDFIIIKKNLTLLERKRTKDSKN
ncbi:uncharacterized protein OCT59_003616 [Rhizophagus irregularis]|uniref:Uncharacterized protein n=1 Tax=Rhizophagus irregularis (strain DAOM 181602 / DAOM 197198 / MUCL 43194) TaxID=747089 RepID=A0A2H5RI02_RHIID|nr:hypothetical protein GLOIN_2v1534177 [Rhizophagus irregularis DAOM 181602=DAOM 197198]POG78697.1 hypothetical protein GLOIN_2v1534177 [Rhizophagus irregularis DAOM 181602=DAOM 197198]UZO12066.1 hypothetical protein OCT59_003616 [Rhizophagus irregularis]|eukprot:XP_025185563.1 hypothetical protein GLOIN_2v1534177 [Rhizophagus irregularis DAOM 181602=DAOM 197198]